MPRSADRGRDAASAALPLRRATTTALRLGRPTATAMRLRRATGYPSGDRRADCDPHAAARAPGPRRPTHRPADPVARRRRRCRRPRRQPSAHRSRVPVDRSVGTGAASSRLHGQPGGVRPGQPARTAARQPSAARPGSDQRDPHAVARPRRARRLQGGAHQLHHPRRPQRPAGVLHQLLQVARRPPEYCINVYEQRPAIYRRRNVSRSGGLICCSSLIGWRGWIFVRCVLACCADVSIGHAHRSQRMAMNPQPVPSISRLQGISRPRSAEAIPVRRIGINTDRRIPKGNNEDGSLDL